MNKPRPARFRVGSASYHADQCEPLVAAAERRELRLHAFGRSTYPGDRLPEDAVRELSSVGVWDARHDQSWGLDWHRNEGLELTFVSAGRLDFAVNDRRFTLEPGDFTLTRPWQRHRVGRPAVTASRLVWFILDVGVRRPDQPWVWPKWTLLEPEVLDRLTLVLRHNEQPVWQADAALQEAFEQLARQCAQAPDATSVTRLKLHINAIWVALAALFAKQPVPLDHRLSSARRTVTLFLDELPLRAGEAWTLDLMAAQCGMGRTHFSRYCRQHTNCTPMEYLNRCRLEAAATDLIANRGKRIIDVALDAGFQSSQYFATQFARLYGHSPREHRLRPAPGTATTVAR